MEGPPTAAHCLRREDPLARFHHRKNAFSVSHPENVKRRKIVSIISLILISVAFSLIAYFIGRPLVLEFRNSPETFRAYVKSHWLLGPLVMIGIMMMQVIVAVIPGEPFELGAGFVFGWLEGGLLCLVGAVLASALVFLAVRKWGVKLVELFFYKEKCYMGLIIQDLK